jgi:hypothetical protein
MAIYLALMVWEAFFPAGGCRRFLSGDRRGLLPFSFSFSIDVPATLLCALASVGTVI